MMRSDLIAELQKDATRNRCGGLECEAGGASTDQNGKRAVQQVLRNVQDCWSLHVRAVMMEDAEEILRWVNDPVTRSMSLDTAKIAKEQHFRWMKRVTGSQSVKMYLGVLDGVRIGVCRFVHNDEGGGCLVSINLNPDCRGQGLAKCLLIKSMQMLPEHFLQHICAEIKSTNEPSIRLFESCGYCFYAEQAETLVYRWSRESNNTNAAEATPDNGSDVN